MKLVQDARAVAKAKGKPKAKAKATAKGKAKAKAKQGAKPGPKPKKGMKRPAAAAFVGEGLPEDPVEDDEKKAPVPKMPSLRMTSCLIQQACRTPLRGDLGQQAPRV